MYYYADVDILKGCVYLGWKPVPDAINYLIIFYNEENSLRKEYTDVPFFKVSMKDWLQDEIYVKV